MSSTTTTGDGKKWASPDDARLPKIRVSAAKASLKVVTRVFVFIKYKQGSPVVPGTAPLYISKKEARLFLNAFHDDATEIYGFVYREPGVAPALYLGPEW